MSLTIYIPQGTNLQPIEIKSGRTITRESFTGLEKWRALAGDVANAPTLIYGGEESYSRKGISVVGWEKSGAVVS